MKKLLKNIEGTRFGNHLYFYLFATKEGDVLVDYVHVMKYWNNYFPKLTELVISSSDKIDKFIVPNNTFYQKYNSDFSLDDLNNFVKEYLEDDLNLLLTDSIEEFDCVFNIRRGDFYIDVHKYYYGFDQKKYIKDCLNILNLSEDANIAFISDDIEWCKEELYFDNFKNIKYLQTTPIEAFLHCIKAKKLVITNSTFSYWAAYLNQYLNNENIVIAPSYNTKKIEDGLQIAALESWNIVEVIPYKGTTMYYIKNDLLAVWYNFKGYIKRIYGKYRK